MSKCIHCFISGRVQGVFFRSSTQEKALEYGLTGWAHNLQDGRVEIVACGAPEKLAEFQDWLWEGTPPARVSHVVCHALEEKEFDGFIVR